jgi:hypothetical protein
MRVFTGILVLAMSGCSTPSDVVPTGKNNYLVRPDASSGATTDADLKAFGIKRANEYCDAKGQRAIVTVGVSSSWLPMSSQHAEVRFTCIDK